WRGGHLHGACGSLQEPLGVNCIGAGGICQESQAGMIDHNSALFVCAHGYARPVARIVAWPFLPALLSAALLWPAQPALADFAQQGPKLVGSDVSGTFPEQGHSVALS